MNVWRKINISEYECIFKMLCTTLSRLTTPRIVMSALKHELTAAKQHVRDVKIRINEQRWKTNPVTATLRAASLVFVPFIPIFAVYAFICTATFTYGLTQVEWKKLLDSVDEDAQI